jgi:hypothetical protein
MEFEGIWGIIFQLEVNKMVEEAIFNNNFLTNFFIGTQGVVRCSR